MSTVNQGSNWPQINTNRASGVNNKGNDKAKISAEKTGDTNRAVTAQEAENPNIAFTALEACSSYGQAQVRNNKKSIDIDKIMNSNPELVQNVSSALNVFANPKTAKLAFKSEGVFNTAFKKAVKNGDANPYARAADMQARFMDEMSKSSIQA